MQEKSKATFPKRFFWGVSVSSHQVEGNTHNQWSVWELENAKVLAAKAEHQLGDLPSWDAIKQQAKSPENYVSGAASGHYEHYKYDQKIAQRMNLNAFRFSIEWSRIEPQEGVWDEKAISYYKSYIKHLRELDLEPIVTLFHFSLPVWFAEKGAFEKRANVKYFVRYVEKMMEVFGVDVTHVSTMNEPAVYAVQSYYEHHWPPAYVRKKYLLWRVMNNLAYAHRQAAKAIWATNRRYKVSLSYNSTYYYPGDNAILSRISAAVIQYVSDDYFLKKVAKHCDYLGVNYYFSGRVFGYRVHNPPSKQSDLGWDLTPEHLQFALERLHQKYKLPLFVTEAGVADHADEHRQWLLMEHIKSIQAAMGHGVPVLGYCHWSLLDNFEWAYGKWPRFGLIEIDYETLKRRPRASAVWYGKVVKKLRGDV